MLNKMSEAQRSMLQAAAKREDRLLEPPGKARGAVAKSLAAKLIDAGLVKEIKASNCTPVWRRDAATGDAFALKLTAKGLKAAGTEEPKGSKNPLLPAEAEAAPTKERAQTSTRPRHIQGGPTEEPRDLAFSSTARAPRSGSKIGEVLCRLCAEAGATIGELMTATGWLEHTTRAALTGLRRRGYILNLTPRERAGASVYRISAIGDAVAK